MHAAQRALAAALTVFILGAGAAAAGAATPAPLTRGATYIALGDSVTFGYAEAQVVPAPNYHDASSFQGYPEQLAAALHVKALNLACPGETSASLINVSAPSNHCENGPGTTTPYRKSYPLHVRYTGSQLAYAVRYLRTHRTVRLVSLMIGANDYFLCQSTTADKCSSIAELTGVLKGVAKNVRTIVSTIRAKAHYTGQLAIVNYYSLDYSSAIADAQSQLLNRTVDGAAKPFHVVFADGYGEFAKAAARFGGHTCTAGLLNVVGPGTCGVHPTYAGQALLAQALERAIKN